MDWYAVRHVDHPCGWQISPWPARKVTDYTPASKDYIHFFFGINFPKIYISVTRKYFSGINFPKLHVTYSFVIPEKLHGKAFWELFSWKISFQLHEIMFSN